MPEYVVEFDAPAGGAPDARLDAPAYHRNREPIWSVLGRFLQGKAGDALEAGSGTGQHVVDFARRAPGIIWWPGDLNDAHLQSIAAWRAFAQLANVRPPLHLDLAQPGWGLGKRGNLPETFLAVLCINVLHIAPWRAAQGLLADAARYLQPDGRLFVYGPFMRAGRHTAPSNAAFDASLKGANPEWGVRDADELGRIAAGSRLRLADIVEMPANNLVLVFARTD
jgi:SAM-dependent methyltransferase